MLPIEQDKWCLHEEGRRIDPFLIWGRGERKGIFQNDCGSNTDWEILEKRSWTKGTHFCIILSPLSASFDHLLVYMLLPGNKSQLKVDYKAMKWHYYEGRVTPMHFYLIWWLSQGFQWYWDREGGSYHSLLPSEVAASLAFEEMGLCVSASVFRIKS